MKKTVLGAAALLLAAACQPTEQEERSLNVSPTELSFTAVGAASQTVTVTANNVTWEYTVPAVSQEWLSVTQQGTTLTVSVSDNQLAEERRPTTANFPPAASRYDRRRIPNRRKSPFRSNLPR